MPNSNTNTARKRSSSIRPPAMPPSVAPVGGVSPSSAPPGHDRIRHDRADGEKMQIAFQTTYLYGKVVQEAAAKAGQSVADYTRQTILERAYKDTGREMPKETPYEAIARMQAMTGKSAEQLMAEAMTLLIEQMEATGDSKSGLYRMGSKLRK